MNDNRETHGLAIGYYIGSLVLVLGVILVLTGAFGPTRAADQRLGFDLDLWWGLCMAVIGLVIVGVTYVARRRSSHSTRRMV